MFKMIVAHAHNLAIGKHNKLPWKIRSEMEHFRATTSGHIVLMGTNTAGSMNFKPLPNRENVVLSRNGYELTRYGYQAVPTPMAAFELLAKRSEETGKDVFIIGGAQVYKAMLPCIDEIIVSEIDLDVKDADAFLFNYRDNDLGFQLKSTVDRSDEGYQIHTYHRPGSSRPIAR